MAAGRCRWSIAQVWPRRNKRLRPAAAVWTIWPARPSRAATWTAPTSWPARPSAAIPTTLPPARSRTPSPRRPAGLLLRPAPPLRLPRRRRRPVVGDPGDLNLQGGDGGLPPPDGAAAASEISQATALEEQWQKDVQNTINKARSQVTVDPGKAEAMIQQKTSDLTADDRAPSGNARPLDGNAPHARAGKSSIARRSSFTASSSGSAKRWPAAKWK